MIDCPKCEGTGKIDNLCTSRFLVFHALDENGNYEDHPFMQVDNHLVTVEGWCPECGTLLCHGQKIPVGQMNDKNETIIRSKE